MYGTHIIPIPTRPILGNRFPSVDIPATFWTAIRITGASPAGLIFELGNDTTGIAAWVDDDTIGFRAGDAAAGDFGSALFVNAAGTLPDGLELDLVFAVRPGDGRVRMWGNGREIARGVAANGQLPNGWSSGTNGSFALNRSGNTPPDVTEFGIPADFACIEPLRAFMGQIPRHFV